MRIPKRRHKGYVLAICMGTLLIISLLALDILMMVKVQISHMNLEKALSNNTISVDQIGEDFLAGKITPAYDPEGDYTCSVVDNCLTVRDGKHNVVLVVEKNESNRVLRWSYVAVEETPS